MAADSIRSDVDQAENHSPPIHPYLIVFILSIATFMEFLDTTVANVSINRIAGDLGASVEEAGWVLSSYLVANAIALPISGWLGDEVRTQKVLYDLRRHICCQFAVVRAFNQS